MSNLEEDAQELVMIAAGLAVEGQENEVVVRLLDIASRMIATHYSFCQCDLCMEVEYEPTR